MFGNKAQMTISQALRAGLPTVFCPRCGWKFVDGALTLIRDRCPECKEYGLDSVVPGNTI